MVESSTVKGRALEAQDQYPVLIPPGRRGRYPLMSKLNTMSKAKRTKLSVNNDGKLSNPVTGQTLEQETATWLKRADEAERALYYCLWQISRINRITLPEAAEMLKKQSEAFASTPPVKEESTNTP